MARTNSRKPNAASNAATLPVAPPAATPTPVQPAATPAPVAPAVQPAPAPNPTAALVAGFYPNGLPTPAPTQPASTGATLTPNAIKSLRVLVASMPTGLTRAQLQAACGTTLTKYPLLCANGYATQVRGGGRTGQALVFTATPAGVAYLAQLPAAPTTSAPTQAPGLLVPPPAPGAVPVVPGSNG